MTKRKGVEKRGERVQLLLFSFGRVLPKKTGNGKNPRQHGGGVGRMNREKKTTEKSQRKKTRVG